MYYTLHQHLFDELSMFFGEYTILQRQLDFQKFCRDRIPGRYRNSQ
jgi:hypothetical protein